MPDFNLVVSVRNLLRENRDGGAVYQDNLSHALKILIKHQIEPQEIRTVFFVEHDPFYDKSTYMQVDLFFKDESDKAAFLTYYNVVMESDADSN